jgi:hypothetical protein
MLRDVSQPGLQPGDDGDRKIDISRFNGFSSHEMLS